VGRLRHEAGQTIVLFAILLPLFLGLGAIAVDVGYWYVVKKTAQDAADAAALAAARELQDCAAAELVGHDYGERNMPDSTVEVNCGTAGVDPGKVEVTVTAQADTFFGRLFGVLDVTVTQRAVAERLNGPGNLAIFSYSGDCFDGLEFDAENVSINGLVHSNGQFRISRGPFWAADGTFDVERCAASRDLNAVSVFGDGPDDLPRQGSHEEWPAWFGPADFGWFSGCTYRGTTVEITAVAVVITGPDQIIPHNGTIAAGVYCATESFAITGDGVHGRITALAPVISVNANSSELRPYSGANVLFFAVPDGDFNPENDGPECSSAASDMLLNGAGHRWKGVVFSPCGRVVINVSGAQSLEGTILANQVRVDANGFEMIGKSDFEVQTALVE